MRRPIIEPTGSLWSWGDPPAPGGPPGPHSAHPGKPYTAAEEGHAAFGQALMDMPPEPAALGPCCLSSQDPGPGQGVRAPGRPVGNAADGPQTPPQECRPRDHARHGMGEELFQTILHHPEGSDRPADPDRNLTKSGRRTVGSPGDSGAPGRAETPTRRTRRRPSFRTRTIP